MNPNSFVALKTLTYKELYRFLRIWVQSILPSAITMTLYFVIFGNLIGTRIGTMDGYPYMEYIAPGLIMMAVITNSYTNVCFSFFSAKFQRSIEELLVSPASAQVILLGYVIGGVCRGVLVGIVHIDLLIKLVHDFDDVSIVPTFVLTPLTYLGGVFYAVSILPEFWQKVSYINPLLYIVNAFRFSMLGVSDVNVTVAVSVLFIITLILYGVVLRLLIKGVGIRT